MSQKLVLRDGQQRIAMARKALMTAAQNGAEIETEPHRPPRINEMAKGVDNHSPNGRGARATVFAGARIVDQRARIVRLMPVEARLSRPRKLRVAPYRDRSARCG